MSKARLNYCKLAVPCAVLAMAFIAGAGGSRATGFEARTNALPDIPKSEAQTVDTFAEDLFKYQENCELKGRKSSLTAAEFNLCKATGDGLKGRISQVQSALRAIVEKLKKAGEWDDFDSASLSRLSDQKAKTFFQNNGGAKKIVYDRLLTDLPRLESEISASLNSLNPDYKGQGQVQLARGFGTLMCGLASFRLNASAALHHGNPSAAAYNSFEKNCLGGGSQ